ncbi:MAG: CRISPR-associated endonuclease Cas1 [Candidatus Lokiarchaeota archaeon]|nr:CRISPR-associated endonuclease Cas1 [Candidatus Lokiarchaeota archaeon]MBD3343079.1 CRISPR-associated endonuclease Cas1 [Candidatus Lokiarchaeota archaeon]
MDVILETPGTRVGKKKELLKISVPDKNNVEVPMREIESIIVGSGVQITSQALKALSSFAINIVYTSLGKPYGLYTPFANVGTVFTRRQQLLAYDDWRGCHIASKFVYAAVENKRRLLLYFAKNRKKSNIGKYRILKAASKKIGKIVESLLKFSKHSMGGKRISDIRMNLMGIEGSVAALYFQQYGNLFSGRFKTLHRTRRPPRDPINSLLSLGYTVLQGHITTAVAAAGLELYGGFLHSDRSGKPSLALDLLEEFRQPVIDRLVARLVLKNQISIEDFTNSLHGFRLNDDKRSLFYEELRKEVMGGLTTEELFGKPPPKASEKDNKKVKLNYKREMIRQARQLANFLIGASSTYEPFVMNW